jgi:hypothetical protein
MFQADAIGKKAQAAPTASQAVLFRTTAEGIILEATAPAASLLSVSVAFLRGRPLLHFIARGDTRRFRSLIREGIPVASVFVTLRARRGGPHAVPMRIERAADHVLWILDEGVSPSPPEP